VFAFAELGTKEGRELVVGPTGVAVADPLLDSLEIRIVVLLMPQVAQGVEVPVTKGRALVDRAEEVGTDTVHGQFVTVRVVALVTVKIFVPMVIVVGDGQTVVKTLVVRVVTTVAMDELVLVAEIELESELEVSDEDEVETPEPEAEVTLVIEIVVVGQELVVDEATELALVLAVPEVEVGVELEVADGTHWDEGSVNMPG